MIRCRALFLSFLLCMVAASTSIADCGSDYQSLDANALHKLLAPLDQNSMVRSRYMQDRVMRLLKKPLHAEGSMLFAPGQGVVWNMEKPVAFQLVMTPEFFLQKTNDSMTLISAKEQPALFAVSTVFADMLGGHIDNVTKYFSVSGKQEGEYWQLCLQPLAEPFSRFMGFVELEGQQRIGRVTFHDPGGDYTRIAFTPDAAPAALTHAEQILFTHP